MLYVRSLSAVTTGSKAERWLQTQRKRPSCGSRSCPLTTQCTRPQEHSHSAMMAQAAAAADGALVFDRAFAACRQGDNIPEDYKEQVYGDEGSQTDEQRLPPDEPGAKRAAADADGRADHARHDQPGCVFVHIESLPNHNEYNNRQRGRSGTEKTWRTGTIP